MFKLRTCFEYFSTNELLKKVLVATSETVMNQIEFTIGTTLELRVRSKARSPREQKRSRMGTKEFQSLEERRAYYRLLRR